MKTTIVLTIKEKDIDGINCLSFEFRIDTEATISKELFDKQCLDTKLFIINGKVRENIRDLISDSIKEYYKPQVEQE